MIDPMMPNHRLHRTWEGGRENWLLFFKVWLRPPSQAGEAGRWADHMRLWNILLLIATSAAAWHYYGVNRATFTLARSSAETETAVVQFRCAGKTHCSQMVSCEEATF